MAENNLGNTQYFRTRPDQEIQVKEVLDLVYNAMEEKGYNPLVYRLFCLQSHYRKPLLFSYDVMDNVKTTYEKLVKRTSSLSKEGEVDKEIFEKYKPILWDQSMEGDIFATYMLAICWKNETDENADEEKALQLLLKAKEQGFYRAYYSTAILKFYGNGSTRVGIDLIRETAEKFPEYKNPEKFAEENDFTI